METYRTAEFDAFYQNWLQKADSYHSDNLKDCFDKFITLYIVFNFLYMEIWNIRYNSGTVKRKNFYDKKAATSHVVDYIGACSLINQLLADDNCKNNLTSLPTIVSKFHIVLNWGKPLLFKDVDLWESLSEKNNSKQAISILTLFYHIRCNLFHGHKDYEEIQRELLDPINILLRKTVEIVYNKLNTES